MSPSTTIIVPTFNEADNVAPLVRELRAVLPADGGWEIFFVDDSSDDTPERVRAVAAEPGTPVRLLHRTPAERHGGLGGAVLAGVRRSEAPVVVVMDGDLQHPPALVPGLVAALEGNDVAVASRYIGGGAADGLASALRHGVSVVSTRVAKTLFPRRLRGCTDPMTGFFALRRAAIDADVLQPMGFKILLEILARHRLRITEVPFTFAERHAGESKASLAQGITFCWQLLNLRLGRAGRFAAVGATGVVVNIVAMALFLAAGTGYLGASLLATEVAIGTNFVLQERYVFAERAGRLGRRRRAWRSMLFNNVEAVVRLPLLALAVDLLGMHELVAQTWLILLAFVIRFSFVSKVVYGTPDARRRVVVASVATASSPTSAGVLAAVSTPAVVAIDPARSDASATARPTLLDHHPSTDTLTAREQPMTTHLDDQAHRTRSTVVASTAGEVADLDVIIPALNEERRLGATLHAIAQVLDSAPFTARVVVVDNGCVDGTADVIDLFSHRLPVELISCATRGKGAAVRCGVSHSTAARVAYIDADLSTPPSALVVAMAAMERGHDGVLGSRHVEGAVIDVHQPAFRRIGGRAFNHAAARLVGPLPDTQCGFKLLDGALARRVFADMRVDGYAFDVELIARLQRTGADLHEMPVVWSDDAATRLRPATDGVRAFRDLLTVRRVLTKGEVAVGA